MRSFKPSIPVIFGLILLFAGQVVAAQVNTSSAPDTLNRLDDLGRKEGWWQLLAPLPEKVGYAAGAVVEEGRYTDNKRTGIWRHYWPNGKVKSEITYAKGLPRGSYITYFEDGTKEEQGAWDLDRNTGTFKRWHPNGRLSQEFIFDQYGTRDGEQKYYHENGQLEADVTVKQGREEGKLKRYYANGELEETVDFAGSRADQASFKSYRPKQRVPEPKPDKASLAAPAKTAQETTNATDFRAEGWNTLYNNEHRLSQQGEYRKGRLWNGKVYKYDRNGLLYKVEVYVEGKYAGKAQMTEDDL